MFMKLYKIEVDIKGNKFSCKELLVRITIYRPSLIPHVGANKIRQVHYEQLPYVDSYD